MKILVYSETTAATIKSNLGQPEYSYYFVLKEFLPALRSIGEVVTIDQPMQQVDAIYEQCKANNEPCVFLAFAPPNKTPITLACPTVSVFAWEFDSIPNESWLNDPYQNWDYMLSQIGQAITHSEFTATTVRNQMGKFYPIISVAAPVWDAFTDIRNTAQLNATNVRTFRMSEGVVIDSNTIDLAKYLYADPDKVHEETYGRLGLSPLAVEPAAKTDLNNSNNDAPEVLKKPNLIEFLQITLRYFVEWYRLVLRDALPSFLRSLLSSAFIQARGKHKALQLENKTLALNGTENKHLCELIDPPSKKNHTIELGGVVFTTVFNPYDGRKNWQDLLTAFCTALNDKPDATLIFKLTHREYHSAVTAMLKCMAQLPPFSCRVLLIQGYLGDEDYKALVHSTSFVVNASYGEGQCLPLMEFLSCGKPAIAPRHSGMSDYINEDIAFVVSSWLDSSAWPHDPRLACRTRRHQINWESLAQAYFDAYSLYKNEPTMYGAMSQRAIMRMQNHCSCASAIAKLRPFLTTYAVNF